MENTQDLIQNALEQVLSTLEEKEEKEDVIALSENTVKEETNKEDIKFSAFAPLSLGSNPRLKENSKTLEIKENTSRFSGAVWFDAIKKKTVLLAGLGGIGSYVAFMLARMQPYNIILMDNDVVETANMSGQLYGVDSLGISKVIATATILRSYCSYFNYYTLNQRFTATSQNSDIMICGFDNMEARKTFYNSWKKRVNSKGKDDRYKCLFIDGRLAAEEFQVFCITGDAPHNMEKYEKEWLFSDEEAEATVCSYKQTTFMANMIGSIIVNLFVNFCANTIENKEERPLIERDLPFLTTYEAPLMLFKTE